MKNLLFNLVLMFAMLTLSATAMAFEKGACHEDIQKYCKDVPVVGGQLKECLKKHLHELSDPCKANMVDLYLQKKQMDAKK